jgi:hypothetical protein
MAQQQHVWYQNGGFWSLFHIQLSDYLSTQTDHCSTKPSNGD